VKPSNDTTLGNDKLGRMWNKVVMGYFMLLSQHVLGGNEGNLKEPQDS
jgi:hypothetical protein